ncbi:MAG: riboflavin synthase, partial [Synergistaceae bacterium]|nr:riboflavin synthase [Synergistaceae bacterium]
MFTGLIERMGRIVSVSGVSGGFSVIAIESPEIAAEITPGESVAVSGACLTAIDTGGGVLRAQMMEETLRVTRLGRVKPGDYVNLERAVKLDGRLDGHIVLGHVDEVGEIIRMESTGDARKMWISASHEISWGIAPKGSVAIDGVSLTVID